MEHGITSFTSTHHGLCILSEWTKTSDMLLSASGEIKVKEGRGSMLPGPPRTFIPPRSLNLYCCTTLIQAVWSLCFSSPTRLSVKCIQMDNSGFSKPMQRHLHPLPQQSLN